MDPAALFDSPREVTNSSISDPASQVGVDGRTYQAYREDTYYLPNDADEQDRLDFQHEMTFILLDKRLSVAPVQDPKHVLDVATGTGIWALDYATENPECQVIGTDLSLIQPDMEDTVPNCRFIREDSEDPWTYGECLFLFLFCPLLCCILVISSGSGESIGCAASKQTVGNPKQQQNPPPSRTFGTSHSCAIGYHSDPVADMQGTPRSQIRLCTSSLRGDVLQRP